MSLFELKITYMNEFNVIIIYYKLTLIQNTLIIPYLFTEKIIAREKLFKDYYYSVI